MISATGCGQAQQRLLRLRACAYCRLQSDQVDHAAAGTTEAESTQKRGYKLPRAPMTNSDLTRLINSDEVQSVVRPKKTVRFPDPSPPVVAKSCYCAQS